MSRIVSDSAQTVLRNAPPRVVVSANVLAARAAHATEVTAGGRCFARVCESAPPSVIRVLADHAIGFECESIAEVKAVRAVCGFKPDVVFAPGMCDLNDLAEASALGAQLVLDSVSALCGACDAGALDSSSAVVVDLQTISLATLEQLTVATRARAGLCTVSVIMRKL
jgi:diaminopimelate decarboxylase